ncbi:site-2 protease family protein, partial [Streptococcus pseudopneumoniae]|uniref:site-2 protease family protein n=1 Tax=Streptococcus pseudopneumoniae TaxID=257758 RepID=UPI001486F1DF
PVSNLLVASVAFVGLLLLAPRELISISDLLSLQTTGSVVRVFLIQVLSASVFINLALMAFNLLPIAPLDGSKVLAGFIPLRFELEYERFMHYGPFILLGLLLFESFLPIPLLTGWVFGIVQGVLLLMTLFVGLFSFGWLL